jgi:hypothetical protein
MICRARNNINAAHCRTGIVLLRDFTRARGFHPLLRLWYKGHLSLFVAIYLIHRYDILMLKEVET